jgi:hypothetical protein
VWEKFIPKVRAVDSERGTSIFIIDPLTDQSFGYMREDGVRIFSSHDGYRARENAPGMVRGEWTFERFVAGDNLQEATNA